MLSINCGRTTILHKPGSNTIHLHVGDGNEPYPLKLTEQTAVAAHQVLTEMCVLDGVNPDDLAALQARLAELF